MKVKEQGGDFTPIPAGTHVARCVQIIDLGTQRWVYMGNPKATRKVRMVFELPEELHVFDEEKGEEPYFASIEFTATLGPKANLRKTLESWRGKEFTEEELKGFDLDKCIGVPAMLGIVHVRKDNRTFANIASIAKLPKNTSCPKQITESVSFSLDNFNAQVFSMLPEWIRNKIIESDEYKAFEEADAPLHDPEPPDGDDIPF